MAVGAEPGELVPIPADIRSEGCSKAASILRYAHDTCDSLLKAFAQSLERRGRRRGEARGAPTDEQMDLLRAMLVFAGAGLDSMLKQLIRDALPLLLESDAAVHERMETFTSRKIRGSSGGSEGTFDSGFLATLIVADSPRERLTEHYIFSLTGGSLQSPQELARSLSALGIEPGGLLQHHGQLAEAFKVRNKIVHELDINFDQPRRNRQTRPLNVMLGLTNEILQVASEVLTLTDEKLREVNRSGT